MFCDNRQKWNTLSWRSIGEITFSLFAKETANWVNNMSQKWFFRRIYSVAFSFRKYKRYFPHNEMKSQKTLKYFFTKEITTQPFWHRCALFPIIRAQLNEGGLVQLNISPLFFTESFYASKNSNIETKQNQLTVFNGSAKSEPIELCVEYWKELLRRSKTR